MGPKYGPEFSHSSGESIRKHHFRPTYAPRQAGAGGANVGHPSYSFELCYDTDPFGIDRGAP
jgi:hypothetical protein